MITFKKYVLIKEGNSENYPFDSIQNMFKYAIENFDTSDDDQLSDYEEERVIEYYGKYNEVKNKKNIEIYRAIWADSINDIDFDDVGIFWSFEKRGARPQNKVNGSEIFVLTAEVSPDQLDWEAGFLSYFYYGEEQWEANLGLNQEITISEINFKPLEKPIIAKTGDSFYSIWGGH